MKGIAVLAENFPVLRFRLRHISFVYLNGETAKLSIQPGLTFRKSVKIFYDKPRVGIDGRRWALWLNEASLILVVDLEIRWSQSLTGDDLRAVPAEKVYGFVLSAGLTSHVYSRISTISSDLDSRRLGSGAHYIEFFKPIPRLRSRLGGLNCFPLRVSTASF